MGVQSRILLQYQNHGFNNGQVSVELGSKSVLIYHGPAGKAIYEALKQFIEQCREGSGDFFEQSTTSGVQWRERR